MSNTVIIYEPQGCGKSVNAELLRKKFNCKTVVEYGNEEKIIEGSLHLCNFPVKSICFDEAMRVSEKVWDSVEPLKERKK